MNPVFCAAAGVVRLRGRRWRRRHRRCARAATAAPACPTAKCATARRAEILCSRHVWSQCNEGLQCDGGVCLDPTIAAGCEACQVRRPTEPRSIVEFNLVALSCAVSSGRSLGQFCRFAVHLPHFVVLAVRRRVDVRHDDEQVQSCRSWLRRLQLSRNVRRLLSRRLLIIVDAASTLSLSSPKCNDPLKFAFDVVLCWSSFQHSAVAANR